MDELIGHDLAGWRIERRFEVYATNDEGFKSHVLAYISNETTARAYAKGKDSYGQDAMMQEVLVLTKSGVTGFLLNGESITLADEEGTRQEVAAAARAKLTAEERALLGLPTD